MQKRGLRDRVWTTALCKRLRCVLGPRPWAGVRKKSTNSVKILQIAPHTEAFVAPACPMSTHQILLDRELFLSALSHMGEEDLLFLNSVVVERLKLLAQAKSTVQLAQFAVNDRVEFTGPNETLKRALVLRLNKKTATLRTDDGQLWKVSPGLLRKITWP